jgi:hypothetical protein
MSPTIDPLFDLPLELVENVLYFITKGKDIMSDLV